MHAPLPERIEVERAVATGRVYAGSVPLSAMPRLTSLLADARGEVRYQLKFGRNALHQKMVEMQAQAGLPLICQASLERFELRESSPMPRWKRSSRPPTSGSAERTGIRQRHIAAEGETTGPRLRSCEARARCGRGRARRDRPDRAGHHHARHHLPVHRLPAAAPSGRERLRRVRRQRGLLPASSMR
jgi:hypothetical protein